MEEFFPDGQKYLTRPCRECSIIVPFEGAKQKVRIWAQSEKNIDFYKDNFKSLRCTVSFAACELMDFLKQIVPELKISFASEKQQDVFSIQLKFESHSSEDPDYEISKLENTLTIKGRGRIGVLYGVYHFLKLQGYRWYAPGNNGEIKPESRDYLIIPANSIKERPSFNILRGFDFEKPSMESADLLLWMVRNKLNLAGPRPQTVALAKKLGMNLKIGGHIFEKILNPDRILCSGNSIWEEHLEWYGLPKNGNRKKDQALKTQFCVSSPGLLEFLGHELVQTINSEWKEADYVDIWGFDTWGSICACEKCSNLGNGTDRNLYFLAAMRQAVNKALSEGRLKHQVKLIGCSYEGTTTIEAPSKAVPEELIKAEDICTYYPINRCYKHDMADENCEDNNVYHRNLQEWGKVKGSFNIMMGEYYNVSKFEDLPLLFTERMKADIPFYHNSDVRALTYMHLPFCCWGVRRLNHLLYSELLWNVNVDAGELIEAYFVDSYGKHAEKVKNVYDEHEKAWLYVQQWRSWSDKSILSQLRNWNGKRPTASLSVDTHFIDLDSLIESGDKSIESMKVAFDVLSECLTDERDSIIPVQSLEEAVNPMELARQDKANSRMFFIEEDRRMVKYGMDSMSLITELTKFHKAWYKGEKEKTEVYWLQLEKLSDAMSLYYIPIKYIDHKPGVDCFDALTRSQLKQTLERCRYFFNIQNKTGV
jgi:uncharacterized protein DUF4838